MKNQEIRPASEKKTGRGMHFPTQRLRQILLLAAVLLLIGGLWGYRLMHNYVNMFLDHYDGTTSVITQMSGLDRTEQEDSMLLPLQQAFDDWKERNLRDEVSITAGDGVVLRGGLYDAGSNVTAILLHPFDGSSAESDYLFAPYFATQGYNILLPDSRAHGESGGNHVGYGLYEGADVSAWIAFLRARYGEDHKVVMQGCDLGANAALAGAAAAERDSSLAGSVQLVIAESPIDNLYDEATYLMRNQFSIPGFMVRLGNWFAQGSLDGKDMETVNLSALTEGCQVPVLVLEGNRDMVVQPLEAREESFLDEYAGPVELFSADCGYGLVYASDPAGCEEVLNQLLEQGD